MRLAQRRQVVGDPSSYVSAGYLCQLDIFADPRHGLDSWTFKKMADPTGFHICVSPSNILQLRQPLVE